ncbi:MAG: hypothetical protein QOC82_1594 [Frankiaceae bacterium]|jgi:hypothetical protein|nr:hypothetical protein [Frankiaceae bacterium]
MHKGPDDVQPRKYRQCRTQPARSTGRLIHRQVYALGRNALRLLKGDPAAQRVLKLLGEHVAAVQ